LDEFFGDYVDFELQLWNRQCTAPLVAKNGFAMFVCWLDGAGHSTNCVDLGVELIAF